MSVKDTVRRQVAKQVDAAANGTACDLTTPSEGWIATMRKALGMTGAQLGRRLGLSRKRISQAEKAEAEGGVTLRSMHEFAKAMDARFVYAILPKDGTADDIIERQALYKAKALVSRVSTHMALEKQALEERQNQAEIKRLADELARTPPSDFWEES
ncbi:MAG: mobile mystery protein A [Geminicoccales bacterium]